MDVTLAGATSGAQQQLHEAIKDYAERLTRESETQEVSNRPPGVVFFEVSASAVARAKDSIDRFGLRSKPNRFEQSAKVGLPIFSGGFGAMAGFLHSALQIGAFTAFAALGCFCVFYLAMQRTL